MQNINIKHRKLSTKTNKLRGQGEVPGILFGEGETIDTIKVDKTELLRALESDGEVYSINATSSGTSRGIAKIAEVQKHPVTREPLHFSLQKIKRGEISDFEIPIQVMGQANGVKNGGVLVLLKNSLNVVGKPRNMPDHLTLDVSGLSIGEKITVASIQYDKSKLRVLEDATDIIAICNPPVKGEMSKEVL